ncbi:MAG: Gx transporter family protein [Eubacteriales bacterium]|jgi:heptaprenyl diphosphate synthase
MDKKTKTSNNIKVISENTTGENTISQKTRLLVLTALLFAMALVLSIIENYLPVLIPSVPGVKFGLSNIAVMYALFFLKKSQAFAIAALKSLFAMATRGVIAGLLSFSGGILSLLIMIVLMCIFGNRISYVLLSITGSIFHNIGQLAAVALVYTSLYTFAYFPVLLITGVLAGIATATLLRVIIPALKKLG